MAAKSSTVLPLLALVLVAGAGIATWQYQALRTERLAERDALRARAVDLANRSLAQGSPLSCLAGDVGEAVETGCERAIFAKPETAAAAIALTSARLSLITDGLDYAKRDPAFADTLNGIRRAVELDRFGLAAQVLSTRDGCTVENCAFFARARDATALKANIKAHAYDTYVARYASAWNSESSAPQVSEKPAEPALPPQASAPEAAPAPVASKYNFPSAASIPPVSIMNSEPALPPDAAKARGDATEKTGPDRQSGTPLPLPAKRPQNEATTAPAAPAAR